MEARIIKNRQQWDEFVAGAEQCNVTQSYEWGQLLTMLDGEVLYVGVMDDQGKMCAAMLLLVSHVSVAKSVYFYAPRGPIIDDPDSPAMTVLLNYVKALAHKYHAFMLKIEPGVADNDPKWLSALHRRGFVANPEALHLRHEWVLDIRPDEQTLLAGMKKTWRYCVRLASRKDVTVRRGESVADIDTFYRILQTTSQRDTFMIYDKSFYEKLVELYGQSQNVALFIAEYEGQALGASLLVKMGRWCWYMYGASSNEHRDRMPNHLLQWTAIRWAKEQGCWYYNFRGIPDVLEESQPMWGVYLFKSGFGGYAMRSLETHDLAYNPLLYRLYRGWLDGRGWLKDVRARRQNKQLEAEKPEKQGDGEQAEAEKSSKATTTQASTEPKQAEQRDQAQHAEKQPREPKQFRQPQVAQAEPQSTTPPLQVAQAEPQSTTPPPRASQAEQPSTLPPVQAFQASDASKHPFSSTSSAEEILQGLARGADLSRTDPIHGEGNDQVPSQLPTSPAHPETGGRGADLSRTDPIHGEGNDQLSLQLPTFPTQPSQTEDKQQAHQPTYENKSMHVESQIQPIIEQINEEKEPEPTQTEFEQQPVEAGLEQSERETELAPKATENPKEHIETTGEPERIEVQPEPVVQLSGDDTDDPKEHIETTDEPERMEAQAEPSQTGFENQIEHIETTDENLPTQPEFEPEISQPAQEELEEQDEQNEETQKLPRIQMAQKYTGARRPAKPNATHNLDGMNGTGGHK